MSLVSRLLVLIGACWLVHAPLSSALCAQERAVDKILIRETVVSLAKLVDEEYFAADSAHRVSQRLTEQLSQGKYDNVPSLQALASRLTGELFEVTQDRHLTVLVVPASYKEEAAVETTAVSRVEQVRRANAGVKRVEILTGNIGYFNLTHFFRLDEARDALDAAMCLLRNADALIIDMRENTGGSPETVARLASYLFAEPNLLLFTINSRHSGSERYATDDKPPAAHAGSRPVFVLTSAQTFSAGEGLAFILQERKRATIVGETTSGAANPGRPFPINKHFEVVIPTGQVVTAVRGTNWEGTGAKPDVHSPAANALDAARKLAIRALQDQ